MRHPMIQREFRRSLLDAFRNALIAKVASTSDALEVVQQMVIAFEQSIDSEFYKRLNLDWGGRCEEVSDGTRLGRWLKNQVPSLLPEKAKAEAGIRRHMYQGMVNP